MSTSGSFCFLFSPHLFPVSDIYHSVIHVSSSLKTLPDLSGLIFKEPIRVTGSCLNDCMAEVTAEMWDACEGNLCFCLICQCPDRQTDIEMVRGYLEIGPSKCYVNLFLFIYLDNIVVKKMNLKL